MKISVNNVVLDVHDGARAKEAVLKFYSHTGRKIPRRIPRITDPFGNEVAPDGELSDGNSLFIVLPERKRRIMAIILTLFVIGLSLGSCSTRLKTASTVIPDRQAFIFAVNDIHANIDNFPKLAWITDSLRNLYPGLLVVSGGDNQTGNPVNDQYPEKGFPVIDLMNATGFNLSAVGNHEFDTGPDGFANLTQKADFGFICANVSASPSLPIKLAPYKIFTLQNGLRLAFLGLLQINQNGIPDSHPDNVKEFVFRSPFETAPEYMYLADSSDILIALTHLGFESDVRLAETLPGRLDLIIGGHSHTKVDREQIHNGVLITQASNKLSFGTLIRLNLKGDGTLERSMQLIDIRNSRNDLPSVRAMVDKYNDNPSLNEVVATATDDFSSYAELGYLMADAQKSAAGADIALVNPGGVRINHLPKGPVTVMNIYQLDPFGNDLIVTRLTGREILDLMKAAFPVDDDAPLYPSGIKIIVRTDASGKPVSFTLLDNDGNPADIDRSYTVAMNSYMTQVYRYSHEDPGHSLYISTADATIEYLKKTGTIRSYRGENRVIKERQ